MPFQENRFITRSIHLMITKDIHTEDIRFEEHETGKPAQSSRWSLVPNALNMEVSIIV